jgi:putative tryptophan/tyrosine transport system substrate-binding protein
VKRREVITLLGTAAAAWPLAARAQEVGRTYRVGFLAPRPRNAPEYVAILDELQLFGFVEGRNLTVIAGGFGLRNEQLADAAATIVRSAPDAIVSNGSVATRAAQRATKTIPIVATSDNMVGEGLVLSLARPGGNTTGLSLLASELDGKRQDLLIEATPGAHRMAMLADSNVATPQHLQALKDMVHGRGVDLSAFSVRAPEEIAPAINAAKTSGAEALNVLASPLFSSNRSIVIERATALRLPAMYHWPEMAEEGGLAGYGPRLQQWYRQLARLIAKVLRGANPADLPVEQPTKFELVINLEAAKAIGHEVPAGLVLRADEVIE